ncbi:MAG TPA: NYN domain-containing protein [Thermoanaerobaculia bacterium]|nr:NYN domain-containing protein [Thermoanaerobaculia bacterium]
MKGQQCLCQSLLWFAIERRKHPLSFLVDGSNLGGVAASRAGSRDAAAVLQRLLPWARMRAEVVVVFDGPPRPDVAERYGSVEVRFAGARSADEVILELVAARPRHWTVVTNDAALSRASRDLGAKTRPATELHQRATEVKQQRQREEREKPLPTADELAHWKKVFGA